MGIIKAIGQAITGSFADMYEEVIEPDNMGDQTVLTRGIKVRKGDNVTGTDSIVSNGSMIRVYDNQFMMLVDGGKVVDYTAEPGYYKVDNSSSPSLFNGEFGGTLKDAFERVKYGGANPREQRVYYINLQEIKGIKFGTRNPINYFDSFYNAELFLRAHGTYSIKITNPLQFYAEVIPRNKDYVQISEINEQYISEFLQALQAAINQLSADGTRISHVTSKTLELGKYMASILDEEWNKMRGMEIQAVGIASVSYDEKSQEMINLRNEGAMLSDPTIQRGYMVGHMARGMEAAGSNEAGPMQGFLGMGMGMNMNGNVLGQMPVAESQQPAQQAFFGAAPQQAAPQPTVVAAGGPVAEAAPAANTWTCECGSNNTGKFCPECGKPAPVVSKDWTCECGNVNTGKFCSECGKPRQ
ncbi:MAG: SPFH domain-containing protein [Agathobacter sp.]|nr:SPFH domain-containing protein [Agathobacter sp.]